ncbi:UNVERIFIED_CONTAM: hypothetical protein FKN15_036660 [Acipenser sinensis]
MVTTSRAGGPGTMALLILCALLLNAPLIQAATKGVTASLNAKWPATPLLLETSEFIAEDSDEKFWQFVDTVRELTIYRKADSGSSYYSLLLKKAAQFVTDLQINLLKFALALRVYSPAVQMFQQYYPRQLLGGLQLMNHHLKVAVPLWPSMGNTPEVKKLLKKAASRPKPYLYKSDHTFPGINGGDPPVVILYAELGTNTFNNFHKVLSEKAENGEIVYVLRHFVASSSSGKMHLSGYGVELAIKSTEYRAVDDTQSSSSGKMHLSGYGVELAIKSTEYRAVDDTQVKDTNTTVLEDGEDGDEVQGFLFENLKKVHPDMKEELGELRKHLIESTNDMAPLKVWELQGKTMEGLHDLGIKNNDLSKLLRLAVHPPEDSFALDIRHPAVMWVNDIETDHMYQSWPSSCQELLRQTFPGVIRQIRRNFFSLVLFIHPAQEETVELVKLAELFYQHKIPLRIGFVFVVNTDEKCDGNKDAGVALFRALNYIAEEYDFAQAFSSMVSIYNKVKSGDVLTVDRVVGFLKKKYPRADALKIIGLDSQYDDKRKAGGIFYRKSGLGALPQALFNGVPFSSEEMDPEELETVLLQRIVEATGFLQRSVFMGHLTDETDAVEYLMDQPNVVPHINTLILSLRRRYLDLTAKPAIQDWYDTSTFSFLDSRDKTAVIAENMKYLTKNDEDIIYVGSIWIIADFDMPSGRRLLSNALEHMKSSSNTRIGVVSNPAAKPTEENTVIARAIMAAVLTQKKKEAFHFVMKLIKEESIQALAQGTKMKDLVIQIYNKVKSGDVLTVDRVVGFLKKKYPRADALRIIGLDSQYDDKRKAGGIFYRKSGLGALPQALFNGVPFSSEEMDPEELETVLLQRIVEATGFLQRSVFMGHLTDETDAVEYLMDQPNVVPHINTLILSLRRRYLDLTAKPAIQDWYDTSTFSFLDSRDKTAVIAENMKYLTKNDEDIIYVGSIWIIADFDMPSGRRLLSNALEHMKSSSNTRIGVVSNPAAKPTEENTVIARAIMAAVLTQKKKEAFHFVMKLIKEESIQALAQGTKMKDLVIQGMDNDGFEKKHNTLGVDFIRTQQLFCQDVVKLQPGQMAVVINGRILGPFDENEEFHAEDFHLLEKITFSSSTEKIKVKIKHMGMKAKQASDLVMKVDALLTSAPKGETRRDVKFIKDELSVVQLPPREDEVYYDVVAVVDPLTREAQKVAPLLIVLGQVINMKLRVFMNCKPKLSERPLKSFYRYVLEPDVTFLANNTLSPGPVAKFLEMPESPLLTLNMITPESWLVEAVQSSHDLDNIHLQEIDSIVKAEYELEYLLLEGHCFDVTTGQPPRGLQFTLGVKMAPLIQDTIVMANLGYFQLKANPGAWSLRLRKGRSEDIYQIFAHDGTDSPADSDNVIVVLNSFHSKIINVKVQKRADKINEDLLSDGTEDKGLWESITSFTGGSPSDDAKKEKADILNIFSVASGHLYERFLRIMMLSVLRHTKTPVKFWFLKNYLSPMFKESIPHMAKAYDFQYELVQYKWPRWLHQQTEKQRIIWGHKILFLDVLFPLAVDKIIFVDADQIVRADLKELRDLDLKGAPYGYTPFCDSRKEMDGYRFWKSGYWASHLANRKYHISALYVVDLKKFRKIAAGDRLRGQYQALSQDPNSLSNLDQAKIAAGDRLRGQYQALSQDPNSLSNLDQDLPNNMIHQVAIKSLPQEWLWCETWCDDHSKKTAKTIDLCNNPKTKEPKLKAAMRIVPEWVEYDNEIKHMLKQLEEQKNIQVNQHAKSKGNKGILCESHRLVACVATVESNTSSRLHLRRMLCSRFRRLSCKILSQCQHCDKAFLNYSFLQSHTQRRHLGEYDIAEKQKKGQTGKLQDEINKLKEQLELTRSQLETEQHAYMEKLSKEHEYQRTKEEETIKRFEKWKDEEKDKLGGEIGKMREMFIKEFKELSTKNTALESELLEMKKSNVQLKSNIGVLKEDRDTEIEGEKNRYHEDLQSLKELLQKQEEKWTERMQKVHKEHDKEKYQLQSDLQRLQSSLSGDEKVSINFYKKRIEELGQKLKEQNVIICTQKEQLQSDLQRLQSSLSGDEKVSINFYKKRIEELGQKLKEQNVIICTQKEQLQSDLQRLQSSLSGDEKVSINFYKKRIEELGQKLKEQNVIICTQKEQGLSSGISSDHLNKIMVTMESQREMKEKKMPDFQNIREHLSDKLRIKVQERRATLSSVLQMPTFDHLSSDKQKKSRSNSLPTSQKPQMMSKSIKKPSPQPVLRTKKPAPKTSTQNSEEDSEGDSFRKPHKEPKVILSKTPVPSSIKTMVKSVESDTDWTEESEMEEFGPKRFQGYKKEATETNLQSNNIKEMIGDIEKQLASRGAKKKPVGGVDALQVPKRKEVIQELKFSEVDDDDWDISSLEEDKPLAAKPEKGQPAFTVRKSFESNSSTNTSVWGPSTAKGVNRSKWLLQNNLMVICTVDPVSHCIRGFSCKHIG